MSVVPIGKQTIADSTKAEVVAFLETALAQAKEGIISECLLICQRTDGKWRFDHTAVETMTLWIGKLEIVKQDWIRGYGGQVGGQEW